MVFTFFGVLRVTLQLDAVGGFVMLPLANLLLRQWREACVSRRAFDTIKQIERPKDLVQRIWALSGHSVSSPHAARVSVPAKQVTEGLSPDRGQALPTHLWRFSTD